MLLPMAQRDLVDRLLDGNLDAELAQRKAAGATFEQIARWLEDDHDIKVSRETVRNWYLDIDDRIPTDNGEAVA